MIPKLLKPHDLNRQFKDLFYQDMGKPALMRNPYNIEWIFRQYPELHKIALPKLQAAMKNETMYQTSLPEEIEILKNPIHIEQRMSFLVNNGVSIKDKICTVVKLRNLSVLKKAVELGADINITNSTQSTAFKFAIMFQKEDIVDYIWNLPQLDKGHRDSDNISYAMYAAIYKNKQIMAYYLENEPQEFLYTTNSGKNILALVNTIYKHKKNTELEDKLFQFLIVDNHHMLEQLDNKGNKTKDALLKNNSNLDKYFNEKLKNDLLDELEDKKSIKQLKI